MTERTLLYNHGTGLAEVKHRDGYVKLGRYATEAEAIQAVREMLGCDGAVVLRKAWQRTVAEHRTCDSSAQRADQ